MSEQTLTDEQVENWRRVLCGMIGLYALLMSREQIQAYRDEMQARVIAAQSLQMDEPDQNQLMHKEKNHE